MGETKLGQARERRGLAVVALAMLTTACAAESADLPGDVEHDGAHDVAPATPAEDDALAQVEAPAADSPLTPSPLGSTCRVPPASEFRVNAGIGGGRGSFKDSEHFRVYGGGAGADAALKLLEGAHKCFVQDWCFRWPGLSVFTKGDNGPFYKFNLYAVGTLGGAAGVMSYDARAGISYLQVLNNSLGQARVTVHEFGHAMTLAEYQWVDQTRTGAWWETIANWVADTFITSSYCAPARQQLSIAPGNTIIDLNKVIGQSHMMLVSNQNHYEAWPFFTYLTSNPEGYPGLGKNAVLNLLRNHARNNDTPLHVLAKIAAPVSWQTIVGRYWARMAYVDIGHPQAQALFERSKARLNYANLDPAGAGTWRVKAARRPAYAGANIIPLRASGAVTVKVTNLGNGVANSNFTATLAIKGSAGVRYVDLPAGAGQATLAAGEEATLVVANTPSALYQYDPFNARAPETTGLNYQVQLTGATPAN